MSRSGHPIHTGKPRPKRPALPKGKAPGEPPTAVELVRAAVAAEDWHTALRLAKELSGLGEDEAILRRAWEAVVRPEFLRQVKKDPEVALAEGVTTLRRRYTT